MINDKSRIFHKHFILFFLYSVPSVLNTKIGIYTILHVYEYIIPFFRTLNNMSVSNEA